MNNGLRLQLDESSVAGQADSSRSWRKNPVAGHSHYDVFLFGGARRLQTIKILELLNYIRWPDGVDLHGFCTEESRVRLHRNDLISRSGCPREAQGAANRIYQRHRNRISRVCKHRFEVVVLEPAIDVFRRDPL